MPSRRARTPRRSWPSWIATRPPCGPKGRIKALASGVAASESFNQLVVFQHYGTAWKIRCYLYASNKPGVGTPQ